MLLTLESMLLFNIKCCLRTVSVFSDSDMSLVGCETGHTDQRLVFSRKETEMLPQSSGHMLMCWYHRLQNLWPHL